MTYIINGIIKYKAEDGSLWHVDDPERVLSLTLTNSNLLQFILESGGAVLSRETLLENVWDRQGLRSSNNTLNQYISITRRTLSLLGADEVIVTIPRTGFCLNKNVRVIKEEGGNDAALTVSSAEDAERKKVSGLRRGALLLLFFLLLLFIFYLNNLRPADPLSGRLATPVTESRQNINSVVSLCTPPPGKNTCTVVCKEYYP